MLLPMMFVNRNAQTIASRNDGNAKSESMISTRTRSTQPPK